MKRNDRTIPLHHRIVFPIVKACFFLYSRVFLGFRCCDRYRAAPDEAVVILSNHQTDDDPMCIFPSFSRMIYAVATDTIFAGRFAGAVMSYLGVIPKKKGASDLDAAKQMLAAIRRRGALLLFPEGNRSYAEFQYYIAPSVARFVRRSGATLALYNIHGGCGVFPRFAGKRRRGKFTGELRRVLTAAEIAAMDDDTLHRTICDTLRVYDSDSGERYRSRARAEYLERMLFVCPKCGAMQTLRSRGQEIVCGACGLTVEFTEDLHLRSADPSFAFSRLIDWWTYQKAAMRDLPVTAGQLIFCDEDVRLRRAEPHQPKTLLARGRLTADDQMLRCGACAFSAAEIEAASVVSGRGLAFTAAGRSYLLKGGKRFNPLKYMFLLHRLDTPVRGSDDYYKLEDAP